MSITIKGHTISSIVTSTIMGHSGDGMFPLTLIPRYRRLRQIAKQRGVTNITKSSTLRRHIGNFRLFYPWTWKYIQVIRGNGLLNAYGLTGPGVEVNAPKIASACQRGFKVIPNFYPQFAHGQAKAIEETLHAIEIYSHFMGSFFWVLELNFSCPNDKVKIQENMGDAVACVKAVRQAHPKLCLIGKISIVHPHEFAQWLINAGVNIIHAINTIPYDLVYPNNRVRAINTTLPCDLAYPNSQSPLAAVGGGGVSGGPAFPQAFEYNKALRQQIPNTPIIMGCGVMSLDDAEKYFGIGANAVSICTVLRLDPGEAVKIITKIN